MGVVFGGVLFSDKHLFGGMNMEIHVQVTYITSERNKTNGWKHPSFDP